jgi:hypothetical protein
MGAIDRRPGDRDPRLDFGRLPEMQKRGCKMTSCNCKSAGPCRCEGIERKREAIALLSARRESIVRRGRRALLARLLEAETATIDSVRAAVPLPAEVNPKVFGAVPSELVEIGAIIADGFTRTVRPEAHARPVQIWRLHDRQAAEEWLATHPDLPDPAPPDQSADGATLFDLAPQETKSPAAATTGQ